MQRSTGHWTAGKGDRVGVKSKINDAQYKVSSGSCSDDDTFLLSSTKKLCNGVPLSLCLATVIRLDRGLGLSCIRGFIATFEPIQFQRNW